jgi:hypothetical protein
MINLLLVLVGLWLVGLRYHLRPRTPRDPMPPFN